MFGQNPIRKPEKGDGSTLEVKEIFPTIQGEGPFAGEPAVFIRLAGCNLACTFCDTEFENGEYSSVEVILEAIQAMRGKRKLVVITGGEPFRQPIEKLCETLLEAGLTVQIETNGTLYRPLPDAVSIVCSPKNTHGSYAPVRPDILERADALKFIISVHEPGYDSVAEVGQAQYGTPVYVQPMDEYDPQKNAENLKQAKDLAMREGYRLSLQMHKIIGVE